jgi:curved DNA-binding protein
MTSTAKIGNIVEIVSAAKVDSATKRCYGGGQQFTGVENTKETSDFSWSMSVADNQAGKYKSLEDKMYSFIKSKLSDVRKTQQQTFTVNGKNTVSIFPPQVLKMQIIKIKRLRFSCMNGGPKAICISSGLFTQNDTKFRRQGSIYSNVTIDLYTYFT